MSTSPSVTLNNGIEIPQLGYGVYQIPAEDVRGATLAAFEAGYRHIDTAAAYGNEAGVGEAVRSSGLPRDEIFITTKLRNADQGYESGLAAFEKSRRALGLDVVDLYLIHWPYAMHDRYLDTWRAMEKLYTDGVVRAIGVSNFLQPHLDRVRDEGTIVPAVNQFEIHPSFQQSALTATSIERGIAVEAYSPLGQAKDVEDPIVRAIAVSHGKTPAQAILRWHVQQGFIVIPKTVTPHRVTENIDIFDFELSAAEMQQISVLEAGMRTSGDPATFDFSQA
ncbi:aldo/keto reductase [Lacisediminihabitans changchengi]|uniref:Aldo/keto reductase n=1 Tax=Lacisediminihabitans changchengi TaxID=2787634 RepID=A0A934SLT8_9MICO|nr:aldo/keto reductase [Lacisediminihabitans changchengi]MBK4347710.1 aldo/keto reductase [Lacisediminihabitans changchengi]